MSDGHSNSESNNKILDSHKVSLRTFEITGARPSSIRDQILKAAALVQSLFDEGYISDSVPLLVLGGGASGVACAGMAVSLGVDAWILEKNKKHFQKQIGIATRYIDPVEFDWPDSHWIEGTFPRVNGDWIPLAFERGSAADIAFSWQQMVDEDFLYMPGAFNSVMNIDVRKLKFKESKKFVKVINWPKEVGKCPNFGAAIACIGFGKEVVHDKLGQWEFKGAEFWAVDNIHLPKLGVKGDKDVRVLVSGGGDGAQQDLLRVLTGKFGRELFEHIEFAIPTKKQRTDFQNMMLSVSAFEQEMHQKNCLNQTSNNLKKWDEFYSGQVESLTNSWSDKLIQHLLKKILRQEVLNDVVNLTWLQRGNCVGVCYALNRFLSTLVLKLYSLHSNRPLHSASRVRANLEIGEEIVLTDLCISKISSSRTAHPCSDPAKCYGQPHHVFVKPSDDSIEMRKVLLGEFGLIIIRHGVDLERFSW